MYSMVYPSAASRRIDMFSIACSRNTATPCNCEKEWERTGVAYLDMTFESITLP